MLMFATKKLSTGENGQKEDAASFRWRPRGVTWDVVPEQSW